MTTNLISRWLAAATLLSLVCPVTTAAPVSYSDSTSAASRGETMREPVGDFLLQTFQQQTAERTQPLAATLTDSVRQSSPARRNPLSTSLRSGSDLFLWNFVALVRAQQVERTFDLVDTNLTAIVPLQPDVVATVPLPASMWLFVVGGLGLVGARLSTASRKRGNARNASAVVRYGFGHAAAA